MFGILGKQFKGKLGVKKLFKKVLIKTKMLRHFKFQNEKTIQKTKIKCSNYFFKIV